MQNANKKMLRITSIGIPKHVSKTWTWVMDQEKYRKGIYADTEITNYLIKTSFSSFEGYVAGIWHISQISELDTRLSSSQPPWYILNEV
jgi:ribosomal protein S1